MTNITIHRYENQIWGRAHLPFFKKFDEYLKNYFNITIQNYNKDGKTFNGQIILQQDISSFGKNPSLSDVEYIIENDFTGEIKVISFAEFFNHHVSHYTKSDSCTKVLLVHFNYHYIYDWLQREQSIKSIHKVSPWIFLPFAEFDYMYYRNFRSTNIEFNKKLLFLGSGIDIYRKTVRIVENKGYLQPILNYSHEEYLNKTALSFIGLSHYLDLDKCGSPFEYSGEMCYRDIEYMSMGVPFIRIEYKDSLYNPFIPNKHYVSIPREDAYVVYSKYGDEGVADLYIQKYLEVIDNVDFLSYISNNQIKWYDDNISEPNIYNLTYKLLELDKW